MDYICGSLMRHFDPSLPLIISYDIACQWSKNLHQRLMMLPPLVRLNIVLRIVAYVIPKLHILGHLIKCQEKYSLNYTLGAGQTDAEGIERVWAGLGGVATSLKEMGPGSHHDTLEDHISHWNWYKIVGLGDEHSVSVFECIWTSGIGLLLKKRLLNAVSQFQKQMASWSDFTARQIQNAPQWKQMVDNYEAQRSTVNPFAFSYDGEGYASLLQKFTSFVLCFFKSWCNYR
jgi:hypothetical protein